MLLSQCIEERAGDILYTAVFKRPVQLLLGHFVVSSTERNIILLIVLVLGGCFKNNGHSRRSQIQPFTAALGTTRYLLCLVFMLLLRCLWAMIIYHFVTSSGNFVSNGEKDPFPSPFLVKQNELRYMGLEYFGMSFVYVPDL